MPQKLECIPILISDYPFAIVQFVWFKAKFNSTQSYFNKLLINFTFLIFAILDCKGIITQCTSLFIQDICS